MATASEGAGMRRALGFLLFFMAVSARGSCLPALVSSGSNVGTAVPEVHFSLHGKIQLRLDIIDDIWEALGEIWKADNGLNHALSRQRLEFLFNIHQAVLREMGVWPNEDLVRRLQLTRRLLIKQRNLQNFVLRYRQGLSRIPAAVAARKTAVDSLIWNVGRFRAERAAERASHLPFGWAYHLTYPGARRRVLRSLERAVYDDSVAPVFRRFLEEFRIGAGDLGMESGALNLFPFLELLSRLSGAGG